jgi:predicted nucleotidyltransferase
VITVTSNQLSRLTSQEQQAAVDFAQKIYQQFDNQVKSILLFGSRARGEAEPDSDMDLLVILSDTPPDVVRAIRYLAADVWLKHGIFLSTRVWSFNHWRKMEKLQTFLYRNICRDGIRLERVSVEE